MVVLLMKMDPTHLIFFKMKPTRCTLLLSIFISTSVHVSGKYVPHHQENFLYLCDTGIFHSVWEAVWSAGICHFSFLSNFHE